MHVNQTPQVQRMSTLSHFNFRVSFQPTALNGSACSPLHGREPNTKYTRQSKTSGATTTTTPASEEAAWATHPRATPGPQRTGWPTGVPLAIRRACGFAPESKQTKIFAFAPLP